MFLKQRLWYLRTFQFRAITSRDGFCVQQYREDHEDGAGHEGPDVDAPQPHLPGHCLCHCHCVMIIVMRGPCLVLTLAGLESAEAAAL